MDSEASYAESPDYEAMYNRLCKQVTDQRDIIRHMDDISKKQSQIIAYLAMNNPEILTAARVAMRLEGQV